MSVELRLVPCLADNYAVLLRDTVTEATAVIDAPEVAPIAAALERENWALTHILVTHHHTDHIAGVMALKERFGATVIGPKAERDTIPGLDFAVVDGDPVAVGNLVGRVMETPGHTKGHIVFLFEEDRLLFSGDTLFVMGCGRPFECDPPVLWESLLRLRALPDDIVVYCGHEYTLSNARFALSVDPDNAALAARVTEVEALRAAGKPTLPTLIGAEKATNPFLRADEPELAARIGLAGSEPGAVFTELRSLKNSFRG
ncbi:hydroxyacylglutathione hydrolase [Ancylobacter amanitiformis]|uniref:Hydroxyacylglutathione hydrolase n=1 Tax=Ancylobacter amanitiformis TaxID=217069 RepID=A0ABU0LP93_9HYPH|nr:hydroxyacylglutathione hydrolase [Ancylobacter amanitiformis]MDQ0510512.1 hydroxyacylglutathione hydrolase [Ancylobacter amanitiformis]